MLVFFSLLFSNLSWNVLCFGGKKGFCASGPQCRAVMWLFEVSHHTKTRDMNPSLKSVTKAFQCSCDGKCCWWREVITSAVGYTLFLNYLSYAKRLLAIHVFCLRICGRCCISSWCGNVRKTFAVSRGLWYFSPWTKSSYVKAVCLGTGHCFVFWDLLFKNLYLLQNHPLLLSAVESSGIFMGMLWLQSSDSHCLSVRKWSCQFCCFRDPSVSLVSVQWLRGVFHVSFWRYSFPLLFRGNLRQNNWVSCKKNLQGSGSAK